MKSLTQHLQHIPQQRSWIIVLDDYLEQPQLQYVVDTNILQRNLAQGVEISHRDVFWEPLLRRAVRDVNVKAIQLCNWRKGTCEVKKPDTVGTT